ncbi:hypothetical protein F2Q69_00021531 [Brassica cretica]|uniref:Uncharacterized protein n=1 Tax=Brassica cretica TaxID=69181 RepID=A0A8S9QLV6_BRACR|nr:hypothetical protein F2Q69_00021531 [Brassica cretica]
MIVIGSADVVGPLRLIDGQHFPILQTFKLKELAENQSNGALISLTEVAKVETFTGDILASLKKEMSQVSRGTVCSPTMATRLILCFLVIPVLSSDEDKLFRLCTTISSDCGSSFVSVHQVPPSLISLAVSIGGLKQATNYFRERVGGRRGRLGSDAALYVRHLPIGQAGGGKDNKGGLAKDCRA